MEIGLDEMLHLVGVVLGVTTKRAVAVGAQLADDSINHGGAEDASLFVDSSLAAEALGRSLTTIGQLLELCQSVGVGCVVDVHVDVGLRSHLEGVVHLEAVSAGNAQSGEQLVEVGAAVG